MQIRFLFVLLALPLIAYPQEKQFRFQGQGPTQIVETSSKAIQLQERKVWLFEQEGVGFSNDFRGARLNKVVPADGSTFHLTIEAENYPVNPSPWYAFKVWSSADKQVTLSFNYPQGRHRYFPVVSMDGKSWTNLDSARFIAKSDTTIAFYNYRLLPKEASIVLDLTASDTVWVAGQEMWTSKEVYTWMDSIGEAYKLKPKTIGKTTLGRDLKMLRVSKGKDKKVVAVISRQHPPEVTGFFAMKAFIERILKDDSLSNAFRKRYDVLNVPLMNPDGVDEGHWRHNAGGVDLNRDWEAQNQPEVKQVADYFKAYMKKRKGTMVFFMDFHSTWDDIYYTIDPSLPTNTPGLTTNWLAGIEAAIPGYYVNHRPSKVDNGVVSRNFFYRTFNTDGLVFEFGDNTSRDFLKLKGTVAAEVLMRLLLEEPKN
ncbi:MAG: M14 family metallopeptidase [Imperialibacter sp.]|uniref:M14 family metallopeptidase n=1 Tax=Imperialibacter sp. TaxID=2038411 RepID=UPI0032F02C96